MTTVSLARNIFQNGKNLRHVVNINGYTNRRTVAIVSEDGKYDIPELATARPFEEIPGPTVLPVIGSSWIYLPLIGRYNVTKLHLADKHKHKLYGNIVREKFGHLNVVICFEAEAMELMARHEGKYPTRGELTTIKAYRELRKHWYKTGGVMVLEGPEWLDFRKKTQKHMMKPKTIQAYLEPMQDVARDLIKTIYRKRDSKMEVHGLLNDLYNWALESVAYVGLDTRLKCLDPNLPPDSDGMKLIKAVQTQFECMNKLEAFTGNFQFWRYLPSAKWKKFVKASDDFTEIAFKYINRSLENLKQVSEEKETTLLQQMLMTKGFDASGAMVMVADMLFAGVDTTSHTVGFLMYHLSKNPDKQKILAEEIRQLLPNKEDRITPEIFNQLHYLKACLKEGIRIDPIVRGNARTLDHDIVIGGYRIPAGTTIFCILQEIYKKEKYFKNPNQFLPERWMDKENKLETPFAYVPFGVGVRSCIGRRLAELEIICLVTEIFRNFEVKYHYQDIDMFTRLVNIPDKPLVFTFLER